MNLHVLRGSVMGGMSALFMSLFAIYAVDLAVAEAVLSGSAVLLLMALMLREAELVGDSE